MSTERDIIRGGITFGSAMAIAISYANNHSLLWAMVHGIFSWAYVLFFALGLTDHAN